MKSALTALIVTLALVAVQGAQAEEGRSGKKIAVFPLQGINVSAHTVMAASEVLGSAMLDAGFHVKDWQRVYQGEPPAPGMTFNEETKGKLAEELGCDMYVDGKLVALGSKIRVTIRLKDLSGNVLDSGQMEAKTEDDLAIVFDRVAMSFAHGEGVDATLNLDNATRAETQKLPQRFDVEGNFGIMLGETFSVNSDSMDHFTMIAFDGRLEINDLMVILNGGLGFAGGEDTDYQFFVDIGFAYYLTHTNISPYLGAGVGIFFGDRVKDDQSSSSPNTYSSDDDDDFSVGFEAFPAIGIEFLRKTRLRLHMEMRYSFSIVPDRDLGHGPVVMAGINF